MHCKTCLERCPGAIKFLLKLCEFRRVDDNHITTRAMESSAGFRAYIGLHQKEYTSQLYMRSIRTYSLVVENLLFFFIPFITLALLSRSLPAVTQIRGHIAGLSPPPPQYGTCLHFLSRKKNNSAFSSLVDSRRILNLMILE